MTAQPSPTRFYAMLIMGAGLIATGLALFMVLPDAAVPSDELSNSPVEVNYAAPELVLSDLDGAPVSLQDYAGDVALVNLWATWCPPCKEEMPALQAFYEKHQAEGFALLAINQEETQDVVQDFVARAGLTFPVWLDENYEAQRKFNTNSLPSSFVIDRDGRVRLMWVGGVSEEFLEANVTKLIKE